MKFKLSQIKSTEFMSDDAPTFYNAWVRVMGPVTQTFSHTWHINRNWRQNLNKIIRQEKSIPI